jgi:hypothetical protein
VSGTSAIRATSLVIKAAIKAVRTTITDPMLLELLRLESDIVAIFSRTLYSIKSLNNYHGLKSSAITRQSMLSIRGE